MLSKAVAHLHCGVCYYSKLIHFLKSVSYLQQCTVVTFDAALASLLLHLYTGNAISSTARNWRKNVLLWAKTLFYKNHPRNLWYFNFLSNFILITVLSLAPSCIVVAPGVYTHLMYSGLLNMSGMLFLCMLLVFKCFRACIHTVRLFYKHFKLASQQFVVCKRVVKSRCYGWFKMLVFWEEGRRRSWRDYLVFFLLLL